MRLRFLLIGEGSSDKALLPIVNRLLSELGVPASCTDCSGYLRFGSKISFEARIEAALHSVPSDVLLVHRDADVGPSSHRIDEIQEASVPFVGNVAVVPLVPIRCTEAWLLVDESAIRRAVGNPAGEASLGLPRPRDVEGIAKPKLLLEEAMRRASGRSRRRAAALPVQALKHHITERIGDLGRLRVLEAFRSFEERLVRARAAGWRPGFYA